MQQILEAGQQVNRIGKYLYKHIDGAYKIAFSPNTCDIYMSMYYQVPGDSDSFEEMRFNISITTYQKKLRINTTEITDMEKTIGQDIYKPEELMDLESARKRIYANIVKHISHEYQDYDFVF